MTTIRSGKPMIKLPDGKLVERTPENIQIAKEAAAKKAASSDKKSTKKAEK